MGGAVKCDHWMQELKKPIMISQDEISKDLHRFAHAFPVEFIPFKTDND